MITENELSELWKVAKEETNNNKERVSNFIKSKTDKNIYVRCSLYPRDFSIEVEFLDEKEERIFGASFDISYSREHWNDDKLTLKLNCGTIGSYSREEQPYQIERLKLMLAIWESENELTDLLQRLPMVARLAAEASQREFDNYQRELERTAEEAKRAEITKTIQVGAVITETINTTEYNFEISHITPKRVYFNITYSKPDWRWRWEGSKTIGREYGTYTFNQEAYIEYDQLVHILLRRDTKYPSKIINSLKGLKTASNKFELTEFVPEEKIEMNIL